MSRRAKAAAVAAGATHTITASPWPYLAPAVGAVINFVLAGVLSLAWGAYRDAPTVWDTAWRAALVMAVSAAVVAVTWAAGRARHVLLRTVSVAAAALSCYWLFVLTFKGFSLDRVLAYFFTMGGAALALALIKLLRGDGTDGARGNSSWFSDNITARVRELEDIGMMKPAKVIDGGTVSTEVEMVEGASFAALATPEVRTALASTIGRTPDDVRAVPDRRNVRRGRLEFTGRDSLEESPAWPGLSAPGESISEPLRVLVYRSGRPVPLHLTGDPSVDRNAPGLIVVVGQPGSGKTEFVNMLVGEILSRVKVRRPTVIDPRKAAQLPEWIRRRVNVIGDVKGGEAYLARLVDSVPERAAVLGAEGLSQWTDASSLDFGVTIIDEAAKLIANRSEEELVELAESIRSIGECIILIMQRVTRDRMPSSVKKARGASVAFGMADDAEAARILDEKTLEAGASPGSIKNEKPGACYVEWPGIPREDWSQMTRTFRPNPDALAAEVSALVPADQPVAAPAPARPAAVVPAGDEGELVDDDEDGAGQLDTRDDDPEVARPEHDPLLDEAGDVRAPVQRAAGAPRLNFAAARRGERQWDKAELMEVLKQAFRDALEAGVEKIRPADLGEVVAYVGPENLKRPRLSNYLRELSQPGPGRWLRKVEGGYLIEPPASERELAGAHSQ